MATLGTPMKYQNGKVYQRWYPQVGDIRPEGLEMLSSESGNWYESSMVGRPMTPRDFDNDIIGGYRIPSQYTPPAGWYCVPDEETVQDGDRYHIDNRQGDIGNGHHGCVVSQFRRAFGGWVLRREPVEEQPCKSVMSATEKADSTSVCHDSIGPESGTGASNATAPVAWQFRKSPMERVVDHYRLLIHLKDEVQAGDERLMDDGIDHQRHRWEQPNDFRIYNEGNHSVHRRPVYAPLPTRLEDVPDNRCFTIAGDENHYWKSGTRIGSWNPVDGCVDSPAERELRVTAITITDYVAKLGEVK